MTNVTSATPRTSPVTKLASTPSASGDTTLVTAKPGCVIRVLGLAVVTSGATSVKFKSGSTDISGTLPLAANGGLVLPFTEHGWFETAINEPLVINLSAANSTGVQILYQVVPQ